MSEAHSISRPGFADRVDAVSARKLRRHWSRRQLLIASAAGMSLILAGLYGDYWWNTGRFLVTTDDAYVQDRAILAILGFIVLTLVIFGVGYLLVRVSDWAALGSLGGRSGRRRWRAARHHSPGGAAARGTGAPAGQHIRSDAHPLKNETNGGQHD